MTSELSIFFLSLLICFGIAYLMFKLQSGDTRDRSLRSFILLNLCVLLWVFFNSLALVISPAYHWIAYPLKMASIAPAIFATLWYALTFTEFRLVDSPLVKRILVIVPALDSFIMLTNPLHKLVYHDFYAPTLSWGIAFWFHFWICILCVVLSYCLLLRHFLKHFWVYPSIAIVVLGAPLPLFFTIMYSFNIAGTKVDFTPIMYAVVIVSFAYTSYKPRFFHLKSLMLNRLFDAFKNAAIIIFNKEGTIVDFNLACNLYFPNLKPVAGQTTLQDIWQHLRTCVCPGHSTDVLNTLEFSSSEFTDSELHIRTDTDETLSFMLSWVSLNPHGPDSSNVLILFDITELVKTRTVAESASKAKSEFISRMSHEMRTPMTAIIGMTTIGKAASEVYKKDYSFRKIETASTHLLGVINDILDISKIEAGKFALSYSEFSIRAMLNNVKSINKYHADEKEQRLVFDIDKDIPATIVSDEQRLAQVVTNLLSNAIKFTPEHGLITLSIEKTADAGDTCKIKFTVEDSGIGISQEQQKKLFIPFEQADGGTARKFEGTGLGLAISKRIVEMMGGSIRVESELGEGASFIFEIEVKVGSGTDTGDYIKEKSERKSFKGNRIMVVEDIAINREIVSVLLSRTGVEMDFAFDGKEAVEKFSLDPTGYKLILMDIQMPHMDGYEATERIRSSGLKGAKTIPIIAMTANVLLEDIEHCFAVGMNGHLGKPIDFDEVIEKLREYL